METALGGIIFLLIIHVVQNDARLYQVVRELRKLREAVQRPEQE